MYTELPSIVTSRLSLTPLTCLHAEALYDIRRLPAVNKWSSLAPWASVTDASQWLEDRLSQDDSLWYAIYLPNRTSPHTETFIGLVGTSRNNQLTYLLDPLYWEKGYMTEALSAFLRSWKDWETGYAILSAAVMGANAASIRVLEKLGFEKHESSGREKRRLSTEEEESLRSAVGGLDLIGSLAERERRDVHAADVLEGKEKEVERPDFESPDLEASRKKRDFVVYFLHRNHIS